MLLPSALSCDVPRPSSRSRLTPNRLISTPPPSDDDSVPSGNGLLGTCRALQSLLHGSPAPTRHSAMRQRLQSPVQIRPTIFARSQKPSSRQQESQHMQASASRITPQSPSTGALKRRRDAFESETEDDLPPITTISRGINPETASTDATGRLQRFTTPKRQKHIPHDLPLGLSPSDFYSLHSPPVSQSPASPAHSRNPAAALVRNPPSASAARPYNPDTALPSIEESDPVLSASTASSPDLPWTAEDDERLVDFILAKFQLSQRDRDDCAQQLGKDQASVERRWQALLGNGNIGLCRGGRKVRRRLDKSCM
ncbi:uncharacterized protein BP01DRAFT_160905 [Aspergillus saccharolyticus JOP 1030-1]|uniref:Myb-like domain-containing protein n=1 Tax=Aspergillus saccharolyticus JOP 1030-1 TaxID=1450539 RepID=A0A318Z3T4_9EURO|nr:hypothetical protein BP01DRAFT_160905 [Aspergillus saccharolyticus JOP 1030-1]PYH41726.1 hypothetical protein BP01DRAFT_160905 [Aspergillus saccharolyticus JOP 1030-1]